MPIIVLQRRILHIFCYHEFVTFPIVQNAKVGLAMGILARLRLAKIQTMTRPNSPDMLSKRIKKIRLGMITVFCKGHPSDNFSVLYFARIWVRGSCMPVRTVFLTRLGGGGGRVRPYIPRVWFSASSV